MKQDIIEIIRDVLDEPAANIVESSSLLGEESLLDSMKLVQVCLRLEDLADEQGFSFDWTSESAMSRSRSIFRTVGTLANEFERQRTAKC